MCSHEIGGDDGPGAKGVSVGGRVWNEMHRQPRRPLTELRKADLPRSAGVYALYRDGQPTYVGKAASLQNRVWKNHCARGRSMSNSAMRRNIAQHLGFGVAKEIKDGTCQLTDEQIVAVRAWLDGCEIAWRAREGDASAIELEHEMNLEYKPPLTFR